MSEDSTVPTAAPTTEPSRTAILVAAFDSQLKWAGTIRRALQAQGFDCQVIVPSDIRHAISDTQLEEYGGSSVQYLPWEELVQLAFTVDALVLAIQGPHVSRFMHDLFDAVQATGKQPPVTISGWVASSSRRSPPATWSATPPTWSPLTPAATCAPSRRWPEV